MIAINSGYLSDGVVDIYVYSKDNENNQLCIKPILIDALISMMLTCKLSVNDL